MNREYCHMLPSEHALTERFGCSRGTVRRAIAQLAEEGYVQSVHGKGVIVLGTGKEPTEFFISKIESMREAAERTHLSLVTKVLHFEELTITPALAKITGFGEGEAAYYLQRLRYLDGEPLILDHNYFLKRIVRGLTPAIGEGSVYQYVEEELHETIVTTQRKYTVERTTELDRRSIALLGYNCLAVIRSRTYNKDGVLFEFTESRHRPDRFVFYGQVRGRK